MAGKHCLAERTCTTVLLYLWASDQVQDKYVSVRAGNLLVCVAVRMWACLTWWIGGVKPCDELLQRCCSPGTNSVVRNLLWNRCWSHAHLVTHQAPANARNLVLICALQGDKTSCRLDGQAAKHSRSGAPIRLSVHTTVCCFITVCFNSVLQAACKCAACLGHSGFVECMTGKQLDAMQQAAVSCMWYADMFHDSCSS